MQNRIRAALSAALLFLTAAPAFAQQFPTTLPQNTVYGRLGTAAGPGQAIPLSRLATSISTLFDNLTVKSLTVNVPVASTAHGLSISSTGPTGGSTAGPYYANHSEAIFNSTLTGADRNFAGWQFSVGTKASANASQIFGSSFGVTQLETGVVGEQVGMSSGVEILAGLSTASNIYGAASAAIVRATASVPQLTGHEVNTFLYSTLVPYRLAYNAGSFGDQVGSVYDVAYSVFTGGGTTGPFKNVIGLTTLAGTLPQSVATDSNFFSAESATTMSRILDLRNITASNFIIDASKVKLTDGGLTLGSNATVGSVAVNGPNGGAVFNSFQSSGTARFTYGITTGNSFFISNVGTAAVPLVIDITTSLMTVGNSLAVTGTTTGTSASANALTVGRLGATTPALQVDASTATSITGIKIKSAASAGGVAVSAIGETNVAMTIDAAGSGTIGINPTGTGRVTITPVTTITGALTLTSTGLVYDGKTLTGSTGTGNMVLSAGPTLTGTTTIATLALTTVGAHTISGAITYGGVTLSNAVTGTGNMVLSTSPTFTTPALGAATATSINFGGSTLSTYTASTSWTPADASGAGLSLTSVSANYSRIGNMVFAYAAFTYPATANGANSAISGLPVTLPAAEYSRQCTLTYASTTNAARALPLASTGTINFYTSAGVNTTNAQMSGALVYVMCVYPAA